jgi:undecaprenyl-diphosphatase
MNYLHAVILGIIEGISEFLPISSTGHLMLTAKLLGLSQTEFVKSFEIVIQLGAILAVVVLYGRKIMLDFEILKRVLAAFLPTAVIGSVLYTIIKRFLLSDYHIVLWALFLGGLFLIAFEKLYRQPEQKASSLTEISYKKAIQIGLCQSLSVIPGVSRAAATIIGGLFLGVERKTIVEFSFLLAIPTMVAATRLDLVKNAGSFSSNEFGILAAGFIASFIVAVICIRWFLAYVQKNTFIAFGVYRVLLALNFWLLIK